MNHVMDPQELRFSDSSNPQPGAYIYLTDRYIAKRGWPVALTHVSGCKILYPKEYEIPEGLKSKHDWFSSAHPQWDYHLLMLEAESHLREIESSVAWRTLDNGARIAETAVLGNDVHIGPMSIIGPGVVLGDRVQVDGLASVYRSVVGNDVQISSHARIGVDAWILVEIPVELRESPDSPVHAKMATLGSVELGNGTTIGAGVSIAAGMIGITVLEPGVHVDMNSVIHHDCHLATGARLAAQVTLAGHCSVGRDAYIGLGAQVRQRVTLGDSCYVGMGSVVIKDVDPKTMVYGVPARVAES